MRTLKTTAFFIILVSAILTGARTFCFGAQAEELSSISPEIVTVENLSGDNYFPKVKDALKNAKKSIYMVMYFVSFDPKSRKSPVTELVEEVVSAHKRGVKVKVILDQNIDFSEWEHGAGRWKREEKNGSFFVYLKQQGIEAYYDSLLIVTHSKAIVIDEEIVILGSTNWSKSSLRRNWEASCLIRSKALAQQFLKDFSKITLDYQASILDEERKSGVRLSFAFLKDPSFAARMLKTFDETAFDLYLFLLRNFDGNPQGSVEIDYKSISSSLGLDKKLSFVSSRDILVRALARLDKKYRLIVRKKQPPRAPSVTLLDYPNRQPYALPQDKYFSIAQEYWLYGWDKLLSFPEKLCYLINLYKVDSVRNPLWTDYMVGLTREFNISRSTLKRGMQGLRKLNIIEIQYPDYPEEGGFAKRGFSRVRLLGLYSPEVLKEEKERLAKLYGNEQFKKAESYAEIVYKGNDIQTIEDIIKNMGEYGIDKVERAFRIVSQKAPDNPKRSYKYVVGILQTEAEE